MPPSPEGTARERQLEKRNADFRLVLWRPLRGTWLCFYHAAMIAKAFPLGDATNLWMGVLAQTQAQGVPVADVADPAAMLTWALLLVAAALLLFFAEVFLPTGGLLGVVSGGCLVGSIICLFRVDTTLGLAGATAAVLAIPFLVMLALKIWPDTPIGRLLILREDELVFAEPSKTLLAGPAAPAVGETGRALTDLRPVGTCQFAGERYECLAEGTMIEKGAAVHVSALDGRQIKVRQSGGHGGEPGIGSGRGRSSS